MKAFIALAVLAVANADPQLFYNNYHYGVVPGAVGYTAGSPLVYSTPAVVAPAVTKTQYHAQDELGQASYGYAHPGQAHAAVRDAAGNVRGSYAYVNPEGKEVRVSYVADGAGFRVASNDLPVAHNTPAVANLVAPAPVQETPEVRAARAQHLQAHAEALARSGRKKRAVYTSAVVPTTYSHALGYSSVYAPTTALGYSNVYTHPVSTVAYGNQAYGPVVYSSPSVVAPTVAVTNPVREATLTTVHNNPGHAVSYRVD